MEEYEPRVTRSSTANTMVFDNITHLDKRNHSHHYFKYLRFVRAIELVGIEISIYDMVISSWLALIHIRMIHETNRFAQSHASQLSYLRDIQRTLQTATLRRENTDVILFRDNRAERRYKCVFPSEYGNRPVPLIAVGDFYALHVLQTDREMPRIELIDILRDGEIPESRPARA
jgi:hypothetical protein